MRLRSLIGTTALLAAFSLVAGYGCGGSDDNNNTGGAGGSAAGGMGGTAAGGAGGTAAGGAGGAVAEVTYANAAMAVFVAKCTPCHAVGGQAASVGHSLATSAADAKKPAAYCMGKTKGECTLVRIKDGTMPAGKGCTGDPTKDTANAACTTAAEQKVLEDWIAGGLK